jgi:hypothetical protein
VPLNQCPVCKSKATKRSLNPSARLAALAQGYERLAQEYSRIIGDDDWTFGAGLKGSESNYMGGGVPLDNLSQLYPHPEKPKTGPPAIEEKSAFEGARPSSPLVPVGEDFSLGFNTLAALDQIELPSTPDILRQKRIEPPVVEDQQDVNLSKENLPTAESKIIFTTQSTPISKIKIKARTIKVEAHSTPAKIVAITEPFIVSASGIKGDGLVQLAKWSDRFEIPVLPELAGSSALVLATDAQFIVTKRTMKYFEALLQPEHFKLISSLWIEACLKAKKIIPHQQFLIKGDQVSCKQRRGGNKPATSLQALFASHRFYFYGALNQPPPDQLANLIELAGSKVIFDVEELPNAAKSFKCMVLVDASNQVDYERDAEIIRRFPILSATWILDCFSCQRVLDYKEYLLL